MSAPDQQKNTAPPVADERTFDPGHVMTLKQYKDLVRQLADQK